MHLQTESDMLRIFAFFAALCQSSLHALTLSFSVAKKGKSVKSQAYHPLFVWWQVVCVLRPQCTLVFVSVSHHLLMAAIA